MIDRVRLSSAAKTQLATLKKKTGIEHNNALCRHALCASLANPSRIPEEKLDLSSGLEIDWRTLTGGHEIIYQNVLIARLLEEGSKPTPAAIQAAATLHIHRGLAFLSGRRDEDLAIELANELLK